MPRRFQLYKSKYFVKLRCQDAEQQLKISLSITIYFDKTIKNLQELHEIENVLGIPFGWKKVEHKESLVFAKFYSSIVILVRLCQSLDLKLQLDGHQLNLDKFQIPKKVDSFRQLNSILSQIKGYCVCQGKLIEELANVLIVNQIMETLTFLDHDGVQGHYTKANGVKHIGKPTPMSW